MESLAGKCPWLSAGFMKNASQNLVIAKKLVVLAVPKSETLAVLFYWLILGPEKITEPDTELFLQLCTAAPRGE